MVYDDAADDARFIPVSNDDTNQFTEVMKNNNTKKKTGSDLKILSEWLQRVPGQIFLSVRSQKNKESEPDSL